MIGGGGSGDPEDAVEDFYEAWEDLDCEKFFQVTTAKYQRGATCEEYKQQIKTYTPDVEFTYKVLHTEQDSDRATVKIHVLSTVKNVTQENYLTYKLVKEDGHWRIDEGFPTT